MFGRKGRVRITDDGVYVEGNVDVDDHRIKVKNDYDPVVGQEVKPILDCLRGRHWWVLERLRDDISMLLIHDKKGNSAIVYEGQDVVLVGHYPTAEEARNIEPEIREDLVEEAVNKTLDRVVYVAKQGRCRAAVDYTPFPDELFNNAERKRVIDRLESLGYTYLNRVVTW